MPNPLAMPMPIRAQRVQILDQFGRPARLSMRAPVQATYDAARTDNQTKNIWTEASGRSADAEASPEVRTKLRNRARYEIRNNSYARGMVDTKATFIVGRVPRLQLETDDESYDRAKEQDWGDWAEEVRLGEKLRLSEVQICEAGEAFLVFVYNPRLRHPVKFDVVLVEADRVRGQMDKVRRRRYHDGIEYDEIGNPLTYDILREHPGSGSIYGAIDTLLGEYDSFQAEMVIHRCRRTRPGQKRPVPEITPALNLFAMLRRFTLAVLTAAESAADFSWLLHSISTETEPAQVADGEIFELERGSGLAVPVGWKAEQMRAEQPTTTYREFKREVLSEAARCILMPQNIALGDSSGYNYSSGRLDHQGFFKRVVIDQYELGLDCSRIYRGWNDLYQFVPGALRQRNWRPGFSERHKWHFDGIEHVDPYKEAMAQQIRLANRTTNFAIEWARMGISSEEGLERLARETELLRKLKLLPETVAAPAGAGSEAAEAFVRQIAWMVADRVAESLAA